MHGGRQKNTRVVSSTRSKEDKWTGEGLRRNRSPTRRRIATRWTTTGWHMNYGKAITRGGEMW